MSKLIKCPKCRKKKAESIHNPWNAVIGLLFGLVGCAIAYFLDIPLKPYYQCNKCDHRWKLGKE